MEYKVLDSAHTHYGRHGGDDIGNISLMDAGLSNRDVPRIAVSCTSGCYEESVEVLDQSITIKCFLLVLRERFFSIQSFLEGNALGTLEVKREL